MAYRELFLKEKVYIGCYKLHFRANSAFVADYDDIKLITILITMHNRRLRVRITSGPPVVADYD